MKSLLFVGLCAFALSAPAQITNVNVGSAAGDGTGDPLRTAGIKINSNFAWVKTNFLARTNNLSDLANAVTARDNLGLGTAATQATSAFLQPANNLSDVANAATARANLGAGTVSSVGLTAPAYLTVGSSPVTGTGTIALSGNGNPATFDSVVSTNGSYSPGRTLSYTASTNVIVDLATGDVFYLQLTSASPSFLWITNGVFGKKFHIEVQQDGSGNRVLMLTTNGSIRSSGGFRPPITTNANATDYLSGVVAHTGTNYDIGLPQGFTTVAQ